ncbi:hypothetical protein GQR58_029119 [Nymphon striatum]|nr:hypothetical protein GQR58_029119 [Nymphon striatum]
MKKFLTTAIATSVVALTAPAAMAGEIAVIVKTTNSSFWQNVNKGASAAIEGHGDHTMTQQSLIKSRWLKTQSIAVLLALFWLPSDPEALAPVVKRAFESGIPVAIIDSGLAEGNDAYYQTFLSTDNCAAGEQAAQLMIDTAGSFWQGCRDVLRCRCWIRRSVRVGCFVDHLGKNSEIEVVGPFYSQSQMATALNQTTDILASQWRSCRHLWRE